MFIIFVTYKNLKTAWDLSPLFLLSIMVILLWKIIYFKYFIDNKINIMRCKTCFL